MGWRLSEVLGWVAAGFAGVGLFLADLRRLNDPEEPLFPRPGPRWKHFRRSLWLLALAALTAMAAGFLRLLGH